MKSALENPIGAADFKAKCLGLLDDVKWKGSRFTITKNGEPYAELRPIQRIGEQERPLDFLYIGGGEVHADLDKPVVPLSAYEALK